MAKYRKQIQEMLETNKAIFDEFRIIHDKYVEEPEKYQTEFNEKGKTAQEIVTRWEINLCGKSNSSQYSKFTHNLVDKFRGEVKLVFPKIDCIGLTFE